MQKNNQVRTHPAPRHTALRRIARSRAAFRRLRIFAIPRPRNRVMNSHPIHVGKFMPYRFSPRRSLTRPSFTHQSPLLPCLSYRWPPAGVFASAIASFCPLATRTRILYPLYRRLEFFRSLAGHGLPYFF